MDALEVSRDGETLVAETKDKRTRVLFKVRNETTTLIIDDYTVERYDDPFDATLAKAIMHALKLRGVRHVLSDVLPDGMLPWCEREGDTLHCDLSRLS